MPETYTPALTRCNTKKGTGAGLRRHGPTALVRIMIIKWPAAPGKPVEGDRVLVSGSLRLPVTKALEKSQLEQHDGNLALSLSGSLFLSFGLFFTKTRQAMQNTGVFFHHYNKNHPYYFHHKCKTRMSCQVRETYPCPNSV